MPDLSLRVGANRYGTEHRNSINNHWLTSTDGGITWTESEIKLPGYTNYRGKHMEYQNHVGFFHESFTFIKENRELLQWIRLCGHSPMYALHNEIPTGNDNIHRLISTTAMDAASPGVTCRPALEPRAGSLNRMGRCIRGSFA